jgi:hypothetical protein
MLHQSIHAQLVEAISGLSAADQRRVVEYAQRLAGIRPQGTSGRELMKLAGCINDEYAEQMLAALKDCDWVPPLNQSWKNKEAGNSQ